MYLLDARFAAFLAVAALLIVTPGPDTALVTRNALMAGRRAASFTTLGIGAGSLAWGIASVLGVAMLLERSLVAFTVFKLAGAAYLIYLGLRSLVATFHTRQPRAAAPPVAHTTLPSRLADVKAFKQGLLSNLLNPKAGAIFVTALPQFVRAGDTPTRLILMMVAYEAILLVWLNLYGYLVSRAGRSRFGNRIQTGISRVTGGVLIALGVRLALEQP